MVVTEGNSFPALKTLIGNLPVPQIMLTERGIAGALGAWVKERICVGVISGIGRERVRPGSYFSTSGPRPSARARWRNQTVNVSAL